VLTTLLRLLAPFLPFLTEAMYQNLVRSVDPAAPESVHLCDYPRADGALIDERLAAQVAQVRALVSLGRAARNQARLKVRQPLPLLRVASANGRLDLPPELVADLRDELNVKRVEVVPDLADVVQRVVRPNPRLIGPRLGEASKAVIAALRNGDFQLRADGTVEAAGYVLAPEEVQVTLTPRAGYAAAEGDGFTVALETALTPELLAEGRAREIVHRIQTMRKEADFRVEERITTYYQGDPALEAAIAALADYVAAETLSRELVRGAPPPDACRWQGEIDGLPLTLGVRRLTEAE
jgi:isoleucyl-tRNA synthetase